jgi:hypothetical protein
MASLCSGRLLHRSGPSDGVPTELHPGQSGDQRLNHDEVHELPVDHLLERKDPKSSIPISIGTKGVCHRRHLKGDRGEPPAAIFVTGRNNRPEKSRAS